MKKTITLILSIVFSLFQLEGWSQTLYFGSNTGTLAIIGEYQREVVVVKSKYLSVHLNYKTGAIEMNLPLKSLISQNDSLNKHLLKAATGEIVYKGKLGLDFINTHEHALLQFEIEGQLQIKDSTMMLPGSGTLQHFSNKDEGKIACFLNMEFSLNMPSYLDLPIIIEKNKYIKIQITDMVLHKEDH